MLQRGLLLLLAWLVSAAVTDGAEIQPGLSVPAHQFVYVLPAEGERVFVLPSQDNKPQAVQREKLADGRFVFIGPPGRYFVFWFAVDSDSQGQATVTIGPPNPGPGPDDPDNPDPPPGPGPDDDDVPNEYGVGLPAFQAAWKLNRPEQSAELGAIYEAAASWLAATVGPDGEAADISAAITQVNRNSSAALGNDVALWQPWRDVVRVGLTKLYESGRTSRDVFVGALNEVGAALRLAASRSQ
jgi:hypothetical protein